MWQNKKTCFVDYEKGLITSQQLFERVFENTPRIQANDFYSAYTELFELNQQVAALAIDLSKRYCLSIISNTNLLHFEKIKKEYGEVMALFTKPVTSFEAHAQKPETEIFRYALEKLDCAADEAILIDDKKENVLAARSLGFYGIHFTSSEKLQQELIETGII